MCREVFHSLFRFLFFIPFLFFFFSSSYCLKANVFFSHPLLYQQKKFLLLYYISIISLMVVFATMLIMIIRKIRKIYEVPPYVKIIFLKLKFFIKKNPVGRKWLVLLNGWILHVASIPTSPSILSLYIFFQLLIHKREKKNTIIK